MTSTSNVPVYTSKDSAAVRRYSLWPSLFSVFGAVLLLSGFAWPLVDDPRETWTDELAREYSKASAALHQAAHAEGHSHEGHDHSHDLEAAKQHFQQLKEQLAQSQDRPGKVAYFLKLGGGIFVSMGALSLLAQKANQ